MRLRGTVNKFVFGCLLKGHEKGNKLVSEDVGCFIVLESDVEV